MLKSSLHYLLYNIDFEPGSVDFLWFIRFGFQAAYEPNNLKWESISQTKKE